LLGQGGSNTNPLQSFEKASEIVVQTFSDAHHAHSSLEAQEKQSTFSIQFGIASIKEYSII